MKTFEEKWTAWLDGQLSGPELSEFEAALPFLLHNPIFTEKRKP